MLSPAELVRAPERVFPTHARVERYFPAASAEEARGQLARCLRRGEGPALLIGAPGTGKSMLLEVLADELGREHPVASLTTAQLTTRRALLQAILFELGQPYRGRDEGELRLALIDYLTTTEAGSSGVVLLVDEAQALPKRLLEELRVLSNLAHRGQPRVRLLLAGSQSLEERFTSPEIETFNQRVVARCYLAPLSHNETAQYIRGHLAASGADPDNLFTTDALDAAYNATGGIARLINQVCDRALLLAARLGELQVTKEILQGAWADLQQLPTPWTLPDSPRDDGDDGDDDRDRADVVEFGPLSGDHSDFDAADADSHHEFDVNDEYEGSSARMFQTPEGAPGEDDSEQDVELQLPIDKLPGEGGEALDVWEMPPRDENECDQQPVGTWSSCGNHDSCEDACVPRSATVCGSQTADLFGDEFEEEVVIDQYASLGAALPPHRPRVTNACETELGHLLQSVMRCGVESESESATPGAEPAPPRQGAKPLLPFSVIDSGDNEEVHDSLDAWSGDDDFSDDLQSKTQALGKPVRDEAAASRQNGSAEATAVEDLDILLIDDDMQGATSTAAAHRADYRQLFTSLRRN